MKFFCSFNLKHLYCNYSWTVHILIFLGCPFFPSSVQHMLFIDTIALMYSFRCFISLDLLHFSHSLHRHYWANKNFPSFTIGFMCFGYFMALWHLFFIPTIFNPVILCRSELCVVEYFCLEVFAALSILSRKFHEICQIYYLVHIITTVAF